MVDIILDKQSQMFSILLSKGIPDFIPAFILSLLSFSKSKKF